MRARAGLAAVAAVALAGCGSSSPSRSTATSSPVANALDARVLQVGELRGYIRSAAVTRATGAAAWAARAGLAPSAAAKETSRLEAFGFVAGASVGLQPYGQGAGLSLVEQFQTPQDARLELKYQYQTASYSVDHVPVTVTPFGVPGIPGAKGFDISSPGSAGHNVAWNDGVFYYLVGVGWPRTRRVHVPSRAQVIAAAQRLYRRVRRLA